MAAQDDILKRLELLENKLNAKNSEISDLKELLKSAEQSFEAKIIQRDLVISELSAKIEKLSNLQPLQSNIHDPVQSLANTDENAERTDEKPTPVEHDLLVIGDSILRDLDCEVINPGGDATVKCLPGARPEDVIDEFRRISKTDSYKRIIVHVGSNLIPKFNPSYVSAKIVECLETVKKLSPHSKLAFSQILPKEGDHLIAGINTVNRQVLSSGLCGPARTRFGNIPHGEFFCDRGGAVIPQLFTGDGIHLSARGKLQLAKSMNRLM